MDKPTKNTDKITLNVLEEWIKQFLNRGVKKAIISDEKYPLFYGTYMSKEDEKNNRFVQYYQAYWQDTTPELKTAQEMLNEQSEKLRKKIYIGTGKVLDYFQKKLDPADFEYAKDELLSWIAGQGRTAPVQRDRAIYGVSVVKKIDDVDYLNELTDRYSIQLLSKLDKLRRECLTRHEKLIVIADCINTKVNKAKLKFVPNRLHRVKGADGKEYLELREEWNSDKAFTDGIIQMNFNGNIQPHKNEIYRMYGNLKEELGVKQGFYKLCDTIEEMGFSTDEYFKTDTPENFNKSYNDWITEQHKKPTSQN